MSGVPHTSAAKYITKLVAKGYRVAICEQTEEASKTRKLVRREVVRVVTPGTPIDPQLLEPRESVYLGAVCASGETVGAAFLDLSTGEFRATQASGPDAWARIVADIESYSPRELLFPASLGPLVRSGFANTPHTAPLPLNAPASAASDEATPPNEIQPTITTPDVYAGATLTALDDWLWQADDSVALLTRQFGARAL